ncbi:MAG: nucleotidyltransferase [Deltaproteobacteria bacterium]|nr:nucleotidyltransferase [Deltaproteobacteria bacterium]
MKASHFSSDILEFLSLLCKYQVKYLIVGGEAVIYYGYARLTGDIDIFFESVPENVEKLYKALAEFWEGRIPGLKGAEELLEPGVIIQFGVPPNRIDLINQIEKVSFSNAWKEKTIEKIVSEDQTISIFFIGIEQLVMNKASLNRPKDLEDLKYLKKKLMVSYKNLGVPENGSPFSI